MKDILEDRGHSTLIIHNADLVKHLAKILYGWNGVKDEPGRHLLQLIGSEVVRPRNPNFWVDHIINVLRLFGGYWEYVLVPDVRYPNEISRFVEEGFKVESLRITSDTEGDCLTDEQKLHSSEIALDDYDFDYYIENSRDLASLEKEALIYILERVVN